MRAVQVGMTLVAVVLSLGYLLLGWIADGPSWLSKWPENTRDLFDGIWR